MFKRPLLLGVIICVLSVVGWVISIVFNVLTWGEFRMVSNVLGVIALVSLPMGVILHFLKKRSSKRKQ